MLKILILGSNGQLASCLKDKLSSSENKLLFVSKKEVDITSEKSFHDVCSKFNPDFIVNAAAYTKVDDAEDNISLAYLINASALEHISKLCFQKDIWLIHFSTDYVFDGSSIKAYKEEDHTNPIGIYGQSKLKGENAIIESNCKHIILRTSWVYSEYGTNFLKTINELIIKRLSSIDVISDQIGCPTYAQDLAEAVNKVIPLVRSNANLSGIYNYCGDQKCSWFDFACLINKCRSSKSKININPISSSHYNQVAKRPRYSCLDTKKFKNTFNIDPSNLEIGIMSSLNKINDKE